MIDQKTSVLKVSFFISNKSDLNQSRSLFEVIIICLLANQGSINLKQLFQSHQRSVVRFYSCTLMHQSASYFPHTFYSFILGARQVQNSWRQFHFSYFSVKIPHNYTTGQHYLISFPLNISSQEFLFCVKQKIKSNPNSKVFYFCF